MMDKQLSDLHLTLSTLSLKRNLKHIRYINFTKKEKTILVSHKIPTLRGFIWIFISEDFFSLHNVTL